MMTRVHFTNVKSTVFSVPLDYLGLYEPLAYLGVRRRFVCSNVVHIQPLDTSLPPVQSYHILTT
jgi:hypothetical protein